MYACVSGGNSTLELLGSHHVMVRSIIDPHKPAVREAEYYTDSQQHIVLLLSPVDQETFQGFLTFKWAQYKPAQGPFVFSHFP